MKSKKLLSVLLAVLMLAVLFPAAALGNAEALPEDEDPSLKAEPFTLEPGPMPALEAQQAPAPSKDDIPMKGINESINDVGTYIQYPTATYFTMKEFSSGSGTYYAESSNQGVGSSTAQLCSEQFYMNAGEWIIFDYWFQTEANHDYFRFLVNGNAQFAYSGNSGAGTSPVWTQYGFTCSTAGLYTFAWTYTKDSAGNTGFDGVAVKAIRFSRHEDQRRMQAVLNEGYNGAVTKLDFYQGSHLFSAVTVTNSSTHPMYLVSGNTNIASSSCGMAAIIYVPDYSLKLSFDYAHDTEANHDVFTFTDTYNGSTSTLFTKSGKSGTGSSYSWQSYEYTLTGKGLHTLKWKYTKDSSVNTGNDIVCLDNIKLTDQTNAYIFSKVMRANTNSTSADYNLTLNTTIGTVGFENSSSDHTSSGSIDTWAQNNNRYKNGTESVLETIVNMKSGETLYFMYYVSSEKSFDYLQFTVNGEEKFKESGWTNPGWKSYTFNAEEKKAYTFKWIYHKDSSKSWGYDCAYVDAIRYKGTRMNELDLKTTLNSSSSEQKLEFYSDPTTYGNDVFVPYDAGSFQCVISRNQLYSSSTATITSSAIWMDPGDQLVFYRKVYAESADKLRFIADNHSGGDDFEETFNGDSDDKWNEFTFTCNYGGLYTFSWKYVKDSSVSSNTDSALIYGVRVLRKASLGTLDQILNEEYGSGLHFETSNSTGMFVPAMDGSSDACARSACSGVPKLAPYNSWIETQTVLYAGEKVTFYVKASLLNGGTFRFTINDDTAIVREYNHADMNGTWHKYEFTAFTSGVYRMKWSYERPQTDGSVAVTDFLLLDDVGIMHTPRSAPSLDEALNVPGGTLHFTDIQACEYGFFPDWWYDDDIATSANFMDDNTEAGIRTSVHLHEGDILKFEYYIGCEVPHDQIRFTANGVTQMTASGYGSWETTQYTAPEDGEYVFCWYFEKDQSNSYYLDCAKLDSVRVIRDGSGLIGDVDGNGVIDTTDALYALRHALSIITLPSDWAARADVTGDGVIDTTDALYILRYALSIIDHF